MTVTKNSCITCLLALAALWTLLPSFAEAEVVQSFGYPDTVLASNQVADIIEHKDGVWFATSEGVNFSLDFGRTWYLYHDANGLFSDNLSAIYSFNDSVIWIATVTGSGETAISDGLSYSDDMGQNWTRVNFGAAGVNIPWVWGGNQTIYDITGHHDEDHFADTTTDWLFFTAFAGGLLASQDGGASWRRIYPSPTDSMNFFWAHWTNPETGEAGETLSLRNRYFSCVADTSHNDSMYLWAGTAGGLFQFVYSSPRHKPFSRQINAIALCDQCPDTGGGYIFLGGDNGMTRGLTTGNPFISRFESLDSLPGLFITSIIDFGGKLFVGAMDSAGGESQGLAISEDSGSSFTNPPSPFQDGPNQKISDFAVIGGRLYVAAEELGLYVSADTGVSWMYIAVDTNDTPANRRNVVHALDALADTLRVGTDSGLVTLYLDALGDIDSSRFYVFPEDDSSSAQVIRVRTHLYYDTSGDFDSLAVWTINRPLTVDGTPCVYRSYEPDSLTNVDTLFFSMRNRYDEVNNDIGFIGDSAILVGDDGVRYNEYGSNNWKTFQVSSDNDNLNQNNVLAMAIRGDTIVMGSDNGFAISNDRGETFDIYRPHPDTLGADFVINYASNVPGITGNWMTALGVQYVEGERWARIWVSNRPTNSWEKAGISVGMVLGLDSLGDAVDSINQAVSFIYGWAWAYRDNFAWNFAFKGDSVFAATDDGLMLGTDIGIVWENVSLDDSVGEPLLLPGTPIYAVEIIDNYLWIGTGDRTVRLDLTTKVAEALWVEDSTDEVYAFPVPFSHKYPNDLGVDFHFYVDREAYVTLEIFDFAMNLVRRVIDNQLYQPGFYPQAGAQRRTWNGLNERGDPVAVGVYYFKVENSTGEVRWGKLAVIP